MSGSKDLKVTLLFQKPILLLLLVAITLAQIPSILCHNYDKIYLNLDGSHYCFRRLNQTHQIGCSSGLAGSTGLAKRVSEDHQDADLGIIRNEGSNPPYVAIISVRQLANMSLLLELKKISLESGRLNGLIVLDTGKPGGLSSDRACPNEYHSLYTADPEYGHCRLGPWNEPTPNHHLGLLFQDLPFPVFVLRNLTQISLVEKKLSEHGGGNGWPRLAVELSSPMHAAKDSITCLRRSRMNARFNMYDDVLCDAMGGNNVFQHSFNLSSTRKIAKNSVVVFATRQDSFSLFDGLAPGADSAISGTVILMAVAEMLYSDPATRSAITDADQKLLLALFDGEAFDYIGSGDTVHRLAGNRFTLADPYRLTSEALAAYPTLNLTHLSHFIELNQLGVYPKAQKDPTHQIYLHSDPKSVVPGLADLIKTVKESAQGLTNISVNEVGGAGNPLPPSSAQSFLRKKSQIGDNFAVLVATNHRKTYLNKYYNSFLEDGKEFVDLEVLSERLTDLATLFGRVLYQLVTKTPGRFSSTLSPTKTANKKTVEDLLTCYLNDSNCRLFQEVANPEETKLTNGTQPPFSTYVSVFLSRNELRLINQKLLFRFTGEVIKDVTNATECAHLEDAETDKQFGYKWMYGPSLTGECVRSSAYMVPTTSPAIDPSSLAVIPELLTEYSLWTESKWQSSSVRLFVMPSPLQRALVVVLGVVVALSSLGLVYYLGTHGEGLFSNGNGSGCGSSSASIDIIVDSRNNSEDGGSGNHFTNWSANGGVRGGGDGSYSPQDGSTTTRTTTVALNGGPAGSLLDS